MGSVVVDTDPVERTGEDDGASEEQERVGTGEILGLWGVVEGEAGQKLGYWYLLVGKR